MSERPTLSPDLTDVIVRRGDRDVVRRAAGNAGAAFSSDGYSTLIKRAGQDGVLTLRLGQRDDLSAEQLKELLAGSIDVVRRRLFEVVKPERQAAIKQAMNEISGAAERVESRRDFVPAQRTVLALHRAGELDEGALLGFAKAFKYEESVAALSAMTGVKIATLDRLISRRPLRSDPDRRQGHRSRMGDRARADPASARPEPGAVAGRHRKRAGEFRAPDALDRRARRRLLEDPPAGLSASRSPASASPLRSYMTALAKVPPQHHHGARYARPRRDTASSGRRKMLTDAEVQAHADRIRDDGYTVIEHAASPELVEGLKQALERIEREHNLGPAKTSFEGFKTVRINNLLTYDDLFWEVPLHDNVLPVVERVLDKECLLSSFCSLVLGPGQEAQPIHEDTQLIPLPRPHIPITINAIWALSDFRRDNGATRIVPGSHKYDSSPEYGKEYDAVTATMPAGSVMLFDSALWHGGGANTSERGASHSPAPIAGAGCGSRKICSSAFPRRPRSAFRGACRNYAATASTRDSSATSTIAIRSSCWAASAASAWCGKRPTRGRRGWARRRSRNVSRVAHGGTRSACRDLDHAG